MGQVSSRNKESSALERILSSLCVKTFINYENFSLKGWKDQLTHFQVKIVQPHQICLAIRKKEVLKAS